MLGYLQVSRASHQGQQFTDFCLSIGALYPGERVSSNVDPCTLCPKAYSLSPVSVPRRRRELKFVVDPRETTDTGAHVAEAISN